MQSSVAGESSSITTTMQGAASSMIGRICPKVKGPLPNLDSPLITSIARLKLRRMTDIHNQNIFKPKSDWAAALRWGGEQTDLRQH